MTAKGHSMECFQALDAADSPLILNVSWSNTGACEVGAQLLMGESGHLDASLPDFGSSQDFTVQMQQRLEQQAAQLKGEAGLVACAVVFDAALHETLDASSDAFGEMDASVIDPDTCCFEAEMAVAGGDELALLGTVTDELQAFDSLEAAVLDPAVSSMTGWDPMAVDGLALLGWAGEGKAVVAAAAPPPPHVSSATAAPAPSSAVLQRNHSQAGSAASGVGTCISMARNSPSPAPEQSAAAAAACAPVAQPLPALVIMQQQDLHPYHAMYKTPAAVAPPKLKRAVSTDALQDEDGEGADSHAPVASCSSSIRSSSTDQQQHQEAAGGGSSSSSSTHVARVPVRSRPSFLSSPMPFSSSSSAFSSPANLPEVSYSGLAQQRTGTVLVSAGLAAAAAAGRSTPPLSSTPAPAAPTGMFITRQSTSGEMASRGADSMLLHNLVCSSDAAVGGAPLAADDDSFPAAPPGSPRRASVRLSRTAQPSYAQLLGCNRQKKQKQPKV